ncbi:HARBI1 [Mytilus coruscus]|uniref:HARBI1 n=1 Tax=Mytilus coruscus TaxID=42192 RepID=A0A6J8EQU4_MYTCO|nr:HARBI1 [Mytilus coruscus]
MAVNVLFQPPVVRRERHFRGFDPLEREFSDEELRQRFNERGSGPWDKQGDSPFSGATGYGCLEVLWQWISLKVVGDTMGFDKSTVSRVIDRVTESLVDRKDQFISWPDNQKNVIRAGFYDKAGFPNVIRMKPDKACRIITACSILHNIAIMRNEPDVVEEQLIDNKPQMPPYNGPQAEKAYGTI